MANKTVHPVHFEDLSGQEFERLVFAYHARIGWGELAWYGQTGSDQGRDIVGFEPLLDERRFTVIQCVNRATATQAKADEDMAAIKFVCRSNVTAARCDAVAASARKLGIPHVTIWSGSEFEEYLRLHCGVPARFNPVFHFALDRHVRRSELTETAFAVETGSQPTGKRGQTHAAINSAYPSSVGFA